MTASSIADAWYHEMESTFGGLQVVPLINSPKMISGELAATRLGSVGIYGISGTPQQLVRSPQAVRQSPAESLKVCVLQRGHCTIEQSGREVTLSPGQFGLYDTALPYRLTFQKAWHCEVMTAPSAAVRTPGTALDKARGHSWSTTTGSGSVLAQFISSCASLASPSTAAGSHLAAAGASLLSGVVLHDFEPAAENMEQLFRNKIETYIDQNLRDPDLGLEKIASDHHVSVRTVQRLFAGTGRGLTRLVRGRRLEAVRRDLADASVAHLSIAEIAARWSIHDAQWLSKAFRADFGITPSGFRRTYLAETTSPAQAPQD